MNAYVNINVRVYSRAALAQTAAIKGEIASVGKTAVASSAAAATGFGRMISPLSKVGNQLQWTGRMLQYNFTLPIAIAGIAAAKFALDNEKAMTRVQKVYGDGSLSAKTMREEVDSLGGAFEALSNKFGVNQAEVINVGADWAAAGASGIALAKSVDLTLQTMILGELDAAKATQELIAVQAQYGFTVNQLSKAIDVLNMTENQTGISMAGLLDVMSRASVAARNAGIPVRQLAAYAAALVPAAGTASTAGNGLKTIITRMIKPTDTAAEAFKALGINVNDSAWAHTNAVDRLNELAVAADNVSKSQRNEAFATIFGTYQVNRASTLMAELINKHGYYQKALNATADADANFAQKQRELNQVLTSNPQRLQQMWVILQNALADTIQPLLPTIVGLAASIAHLANWFANLSPTVQKIIGLFLLFLALFGPLIRYVGALFTLVGQLGIVFKVVAGKLFVLIGTFIEWAAAMGSQLLVAIGALIGRMIALGIVAIASARRVAIAFAVTMLSAVRAAVTATTSAVAGLTASIIVSFRMMAIAVVTSVRRMIIAGLSAMVTALGPWGIAIVGAIAAVIVVIYTFRDQIAAAFNWVIHQFSDVNGAFNSITRGIIRAFYALPQGVQGALQSLVNIVRAAAMAVYEWLSYLNPFATHSPSLVSQVNRGVDQIIYKYGTLETIGQYLADVAKDIRDFNQATKGLGGGEFTDDLKAIAKVRPAALDEFKVLLIHLHNLKDILRQVSNEVDAQEKVVAHWSTALDAANRKLSNEQDLLDSTQAKLDKLTAAYDRHKQAMENYANAPIKGMQEMSDKIFQNEQAQKKLRLEIMKWEKANGSIEDMRNNMAALAGDIEKLRGEANDLRTSGAGSDILGPINDQIATMQSQYDQMTNTISNSPIDDLTAQLDALDAKGQRLDLKNSLRFDGPLRQIDQLSTDMKELPFSTIIQGIKDQQAAMDDLQPHIDAQTAAVKRQQKAVDDATAARDRIQKRYDSEQAKLDRLNERYSQIESSISDITSALNDMGSAASSAIDKAKQAADKAKSSAGGAAAAAGAGKGPLGAAGGFPTPGGNAQIGRQGGSASQADMIDQFTAGITDDVSKMFDSINIIAPLREKWDAAWAWVADNIGPVFDNIGNLISNGWNAAVNKLSGGGTGGISSFFDSVKGIFNGISGFLKTALQFIAPGLSDIWNALKNFFTKIWTDIGPEVKKSAELFGPLVEALGHIFNVVKVVVGVIAAVLLPVFALLFNVLGAVLGPILNMVVEFIAGFLRTFRGFAQFVLAIINGDWKQAWQGLVDIFGGIWDEIFAIFRGAIGIVVGIFKGIWNTVVAIAKWFYNVLVGHSIIPDLVKAIVGWFNWMVAPIKAAWALLSAGIAFVWNNILKPLFAAAGDIIKAWAETFKWIWTNIIQPAWDAIKQGIKVFWNNFLKPILATMKEALKGWVIIFKWIWQNVIQPAWDKIKEIIKGFWDNFAKPFLSTMKDGIKTWAQIFHDIWVNIIKPAWDAIKTGIQAVWQNVLKPLWDTIKQAFHELGDVFRTDWNNVIKPAWEAIKTGISDAWDKIKVVWNLMKTAWGNLRDAFRTVGGAIKSVFTSVWNRIQDVVGWIADKIDWLVDKADKAKSLISWIPGVSTGGSVGGQAKGGLAFAAGGSVLGPGTKTSDSILTRLSRGEFVVRAAAVDALGLPFMNWVNSQGYMSGGVVSARGRADSAWGGSLTPTVIINNNTSLEFNGNLTFPNITDPDDAAEFIENLKGLAA